MNGELTDLQRALMSIMRTKSTGPLALPGEPQAFSLTDLHLQLVRREWPVREILPAHILTALNALRERNLVRSDTYWRMVQPGHDTAAEKPG